MIFNNSYSGLVTNGLGLSASCMLNANFYVLTCSITITPLSPKYFNGGSGGGPYNVRTSYAKQHTNWLTPASNEWKMATHYVMITMKHGDHTWKKSYVVSKNYGRLLISVVNIVRRFKSQYKAVVENISRISRRKQDSNK